MSSDPIEALRAALAVTPDNAPLRRHLADTLFEATRYIEAEEEYRELLRTAPSDAQLKTRLADTYFQLGRLGEAGAIVESLIDAGSPPASACLLYARLCMKEGRVPDAVAHYKHALDIDPLSADDELTERLGVTPPQGYEEHGVDDDAEVVDGRVRQRAGGGEIYTELERPAVGFNDVGGMEDVKEEIRVKIIYPLEHREVYEAYGKPIGGGIMMYGPPGCGKTYLARATAGEIQANFLSIGINDVLEMWIGSSERNLSEVFERARASAPCVLFFDEVDALGGRRSDMQGGAQRQLINQFLAELDGAEKSNEGVLGARGDERAVACRRGVPSAGAVRPRAVRAAARTGTARAEVLRVQCAGKPLKDVDYEYLAGKTEQVFRRRLAGGRRSRGGSEAVRGDPQRRPAATDHRQGPARPPPRSTGRRPWSGSPRRGTTPCTPTRAGSTTTC